ncbi:MAG: hypothetical protein Q9N34_11020 [Aquificota bacterium]|nr:hypothetical protein [Aquificota bacterium]
MTGRRYPGTGGVFEGKAFLYQGTVLVDFNVERMLKSLQIPVEKLTSKGIKAAEDRVTWLKRELGRIPPKEEVFEALLDAFREELGISGEWGDLTRGGAQALGGEEALLQERGVGIPGEEGA